MTTYLEKAKKIFEYRFEIDGEIGTASTAYIFDRIGRVERNILRLALYEIKYEQAPVAVLISEALRLAKKFATEESGRFVHAIIEKCAAERV